MSPGAWSGFERSQVKWRGAACHNPNNSDWDGRDRFCYALEGWQTRAMP